MSWWRWWSRALLNVQLVCRLCRALSQCGSDHWATRPQLPPRSGRRSEGGGWKLLCTASVLGWAGSCHAVQITLIFTKDAKMRVSFVPLKADQETLVFSLLLVFLCGASPYFTSALINSLLFRFTPWGTHVQEEKALTYKPARWRRALKTTSTSFCSNAKKPPSTSDDL